MSRRNWSELIILAALWGAVYVLSVVVLRGWSPVQVVFGRCLLATVVLVPVAMHQRAIRAAWKRPLITGLTVLVQVTIPLLFLTFGQQYIDSGLAGIIVGAQPLFLALLALRFAPDQVPRTFPAMTGVVLGFAGLALLFGFDLSTGSWALLGGGLVLLSALGYAGGALMAHRYLSDVPPMGVAASAMIVSSIALVVPAGLSTSRDTLDINVLGSMIVLGVFCTGGALALYYRLIRRVGPAQAALAFYLSPGFAVIFGAVFLGEGLRPSVIIGLGAIVVGSVLAAGRESPGGVSGKSNSAPDRVTLAHTAGEAENRRF